MKKVLAGILVLITVLSLFGCKTDDPISTNATVDEVETTVAEITESIALEGEKFPAGTTLCGVNVGEMGQADAYATLKRAVDDYTLQLTVNGKTILLSSKDLGLSLSKEKFDTYFKALTGGEKLPVPELLTFKEDSIKKAVTDSIGVKVKNASIEYNHSAGSFRIKPAAKGLSVICDPAVEAGKRAIAYLNPTASATVKTSEVNPTITEKSSQAQNGQKKANNYLKVNLKYTYAPEGVSPKTVTLTKTDIASFITFNDKLEPTVSKALVENYAINMNEKHSVPGEAGKFVTTGGETINVNVTYSGQQVNIEALRDDIYSCITNNVSGTRKAPYHNKAAVGDMSFGGNYVEVDMSRQHLWVYKNGKCVVSTPVVTGTAYNGMITPRGVYKINKKVRNATLVGADYETVVEYWMAFIGNGYGLHDAGWRPYSDFGGDTYLYNGSHGCVNIPLSVMPEVYKNAGVGTHVILYGGATNADPVKQSFTGTSKVTTALDKSFKLDVKPKYNVDEITYTVADSSVLTVSKNGTVTPKKIGTTTVTVTSPKQAFYTKATFKVTITVKDPCELRGHSCKNWTLSTSPNCTEAGLETGNCAKCGKFMNREVPATGHSFAVGNEFCNNGCGERNPNYTAPTEPVTTIPDTTVSVSENIIQ